MMARRMLMAMICSAMIQLVISTTTECPDQSQQLVKGVCVYIRRLSHVKDRKKFSESFDAVSKECDGLKIGQLKWYAPKVETFEKQKKLEQALEKFMVENPIDRRTAVPPFEKKKEWEYPSIWLGLRRIRPVVDAYKSTEEEMWYWTKDNSTLSVLRTYGRDFWDLGQPDSEVGENQTCAICMYMRDQKRNVVGERLKFADVECEGPSSTSINADRENFTVYRLNLIGLVCMADQKKPTPTTTPSSSHILDQWWFYLICALFVVVPIIVLLIVCIVVIRKDDQKKREKKNRGGYRSRKPLRRYAVQREPSDELTESSRTLEPYENVSVPPCPPSPRVGYHCPSECEPRSKMSADDDDHDYSNVEPRKCKPPGPISRGRK